MKDITENQLIEIVENHKIWLESNFKKGEKANLSSTTLIALNLSDVNLSKANLMNANLFDADLSDANLRGADLSDADLSDADLSNADLSYADLSNADLSYADLRYADLSNADLSYADLTLTDLHGANLKDAKLACTSLPLRCGSLHANFDENQVAQFLYYVLSMVQNSYNVSEIIQQTLLTELNVNFANKFHNPDFYNGDKLIAYKNTKRGKFQDGKIN